MLNIEFSPEVISQELKKEIEKLQKSILPNENKIKTLESQIQQVPQYKIHTWQDRRGFRHEEVSNKREISQVNSSNYGIQEQIKKIKENIQNSKLKIKERTRQIDLMSREIDIRNKRSAEDFSNYTKATTNKIKNINNAVIGQSMQNESLRNKMILGGVILGGLFVLSKS